MTAADFSASMANEPTMIVWPEAESIDNKQVSTEIAPIGKKAAVALSKNIGVFGRIDKFSPDDTIKIMKFARAVLMTIGETFLKFTSSRLIGDVTGLCMKGTKGIADSINQAKTVAEVFVDTIGSKGLGRIFDFSASGGFFDAVANHTKNESSPIENPVTLGENLTNIRHNYKRTEEFSKSIMAWHNIFKAPMWASGVIKSIADTTGSALGQSLATLTRASVGITLVDILAFNLPGHLTWIYYHTGVTYDITAEAFKAGFNHSDNESHFQSMKHGIDAAVGALTSREVVDSHILPAVRFAAQTGLIVGLGLIRTTGGPALLLGMAAWARPFAMNWVQALGCMLAESAIGAYKTWVKTGPKDTSSADQLLVNLGRANSLQLTVPNRVGIAA